MCIRSCILFQDEQFYSRYKHFYLAEETVRSRWFDMSVFFVGSNILVMVCANNTLSLSGIFVTDCPESTITFAYTGMV